jgi:predicted metal-dependent hydrolase
MAGFFRKLRKAVTARPIEPATVDCAGLTVDVMFRRNAGARRLILRLNTEGTAAVVTVPHGVSRAQALDFVSRSSDWLAERLSRRGENIPLRPGSAIPLRGVPHDIRHINVRRGTVTVDALARNILVPGDLPHVARRLVDFLKAAARLDLAAASQRYATAMGVSFRRITIRDQRSRWGSCSARGELSYSWRLILTPSYVLDYVAAHEVAHLVHMNHGRKFWRLVLSHCPEAGKAKKWLKEHGHGVHRFVA